jgi:dTDP-glucose 4,6-dehydratase
VRLLVTGGAGFIGSTFVHRRLSDTHDSITVLDKLTYAGSLANLDGALELADRCQFIQGDIADADLVADLVQGCDGIVNFAAESHVDRSILDPTAFLRTGVLGVHSLLEAARREQHRRGSGPSYRVVQVSTDEVYGSVPTGRSREEDPVRPSSPYSAAKAAGEHLVQAYHETFGLDTVITRGANTYGPRQHPEKLIPLFVTNALTDQPLPMYGDGEQRRDWLYVDDHVAAVQAVLDRGRSGSVYNVPGDGEERSNRSVTAAILDHVGKPWSLVHSVADRPGHDRRYALDGSRLRALGWAPRVAFEDGIEATVAWYRDHEAWWRTARSGDWDDYYRRQYGWRIEGSGGA